MSMSAGFKQEFSARRFDAVLLSGAATISSTRSPGATSCGRPAAAIRPIRPATSIPLHWTR
ncbi:MAG: hypothetical protein HS110_07920 [Zoogloeaceae bacterium]|nr:hypothetical protein [Zoogloeaceae bacterium]